MSNYIYTTNIIYKISFTIVQILLVDVKEAAFGRVDGNHSRIVEISDLIWRYAELGLVEYKSPKLLADTLEGYGFKVNRGVADMSTVFTATYGSGKK